MFSSLIFCLHFSLSFPTTSTMQVTLPLSQGTHWSKLTFHHLCKSTGLQGTSYSPYIQKCMPRMLCVVSPLLPLNLLFLHSECFLSTASAYWNTIYENPVQILFPPWSLPRLPESKPVCLFPIFPQAFICLSSKAFPVFYFSFYCQWVHLNFSTAL